jgi:hypothetical protein
MQFRNKVTDAMNSGKVMRFHQHVKIPVELDDEGNQKLDEDVVDFFYRGGEFPRHARFRRDEGELVEVFDKTTSGPAIGKVVDDHTVYFEDPADTPVEECIDWDWIEGNWE